MPHGTLALLWGSHRHLRQQHRHMVRRPAWRFRAALSTEIAGMIMASPKNSAAKANHQHNSMQPTGRWQRKRKQGHVPILSLIIRPHNESAIGRGQKPD